MTKLISSIHWTNVYQDLWSILVTTSPAVSTGLVGTNIILCCSDGKIALHQARIDKFTVLLDSLKSELCLEELADPWGNLVLVLPHLKMEVVHALGRLIYCGDSGDLKKEIMQELMDIIRPEFGGNKRVQKPVVGSQPNYLRTPNKKNMKA